MTPSQVGIAVLLAWWALLGVIGYVRSRRPHHTPASRAERAMPGTLAGWAADADRLRIRQSRDHAVPCQLPKCRRPTFNPSAICDNH